MKKFLNISYILLGVMIILASCNSEEISGTLLPDDSDMPIEFSGINASLDTKAGVDDIASFRVWASRTTNNATVYDIFSTSGTAVTKTISGNSISWIYSPTRYWQPGTYDFYAITPTAISTSIPVSGELSSTSLAIHFGEEVDGAYAGWDLSVNQTDLMLATEPNVTGRFNATNTPVNLAFNHMLSKIRFSAKKTTDMQIDIVMVKISGHLTTASSVEMSGNGATWTLSTVSTGQEIGLSTPIALDKVQDKPVTSELLVFPQGARERDKGTVEGIRRDADNAGGYPKSASITTDWQAGKQYDYVINVGPDGISFSEPTVKPWDDNGGTGHSKDEIEF